MTVINNDARDQYVATNGQTIFNYTFEITDQANIQVYQRASGSSPNDAADILILTTDYTVTGVNVNTGGTIILNSGATTGDIITLQGNAPPERSTSFTPGGVIQASNLNLEFDEEILIYQTILGVQDFLIPKYPKSAIVAAVDLILPILDEDQTWVMNSNRTAIVAADFPSDGAANKLDTYVTITDATANEPNSFPLSAIGSGIMINNVGGQAILTRDFVGTINQIDVANGDGLSGDPTISITANPQMPGTAGMGIPSGTTAQRVIPTPPNINLRFNTDLDLVEYYDSDIASWVSISNDTALLALLASHAAGEGASLIGLEGTGTVQDLANAIILLESADPAVPNGLVLTAGTNVTLTPGVGTLTIDASPGGGVNPGLINELAYYAAAGNVLSGLTTAVNGTLVTDGTGVPSISSTLPTAVQNNITLLGTLAEALDLGTHLINNVVDPVSPQDAATKNYVDTVATGRKYKDPVDGASTVALTVTYNNGASGVGATLTNAGVQAALVLDGYSFVVGDRALIKNQASSFQDGIYIVNDIGSGATDWVMTRSIDLDHAVEFKGATTLILNGSTQAGQTWTQTATITTIGTDAQTWIQTGDATGVTSVATGTGLTGGTITSTGTISFAAIAANSFWANITGGAAVPTVVGFPITLALGGTNKALTADAGGIVYSDADSFEILAHTTTAGLALLSGNAAPPTWSIYPPITRVNTQTFSSTQAYTKTANTQFAFAQVMGGGGGSGGCASGAGLISTAAGGGGSSPVAEGWFTAAQLGTGGTATIGAGGAAATAGANNGGTGGTSSLALNGTGTPTIASTGGIGGGGATTGSTLGGLGGTGGSVSGGTFGSVASAGSGNHGCHSGVLFAIGGKGADSQWGSGGISQAVNNGSGNGNAGTGYGSGASGACCAQAGSNNFAGTAGQPGFIVVYEYISE